MIRTSAFHAWCACPLGASIAKDATDVWQNTISETICLTYALIHANNVNSHCPWVYNCIGVNNHRHFFLYLLFLELGLAFLVRLTIGCECLHYLHSDCILILSRL